MRRKPAKKDISHFHQSWNGSFRKEGTMRAYIPFTVVATVLLASAATPAFAGTQDTGEAAAAKVNIQAVTTLLGTITPAINTAIADTGTLASNTDMRQASGLSGG